MHKGLVSTIIPVFNRAELLREAVSSVLGQKYRPIEIVIVDDGSTDRTSDVADELERENPGIIQVLHIRNSGPGSAREAGRTVANGEFIQYLDSDDVLLPEKFVHQVAGLEGNPDLAISYCVTRYRGWDGRIIEEAWKRTGEYIESLFPSMLLGRWWGTSTPLYRRSAVDKVGPWSELVNEEDWEYDCRFAADGVKLHYVPRVLSEERGHAGPRMSDDGGTDPCRLSSRAKAHEIVYGYVRAAGIENSDPTARQFSRTLFLLSRQCGAAGLVACSRRLFKLARELSSGTNGFGLDYSLYELGAKLMGWRLMGRACRYMDGFRGTS
jgi:glycosyltransferase involved in cell wall biosynthesis